MPDGHRHVERAAVPAKNIVIVVFEGAEAVDIAAPASVFTKAEQLHAGTYRLCFASPKGGDVQTNSGLWIRATHSFEAVPATLDTLIVAGGDEAPLRALLRDGSVAEWLARVAPGTRRIASVCSGAFALAAAGLLDGREATTHWSALDLLQSVRPAVRVLRDRIYVRDGQVWTSAGVTTSLELALALVEDDLGQSVSMAIARTLALPMLRGSHQPQLSQALQVQTGARNPLRELIAWMSTHLHEQLTVELLAQRANMSARQFARAFAAETGCTPARFVERARVAQAADLLVRTRWPQDRIAELSGFGSVDALQRAFARQHGKTLKDYRASKQLRV
ncbi:GlxA family transcriptional regulator [Ramlibacter tataouinensis]|uniref:Transcriptional regulator, AraC family-like protein n=1 Tax=Ramlibacter tataouinensis (strain ATCC BAA-407 / DSM 14655 / LMG 21543 / TTB310) TaxID=365046 RepID=F5Y6I3_RAMTT|nr:DJ-1/PfpI family protein [Ramlibacter tataouinensis]AEG94057.1 transcriptional regulator, AraC family-like protein [Ramlibacter tataouinensis TTB310]